MESTNERQRIAKVKIYPGADVEFEMYRDDGTTYEYEKGSSKLTPFHWADGEKKLTRSGQRLKRYRRMD